MTELIDKYIQNNKSVYMETLISDSSLSSESKTILINNNICTIYDLLIAANKLEKLFYFNPCCLEEIEDYIFSLKSNITDELDCFPELEEWNVFLEALDEIVSLEPLICALCGKHSSAYSIRIADEQYINVCDNCAAIIKKHIYTFLNEKDLW